MRISDWSSDVCSSDLSSIAAMPDSALSARSAFTCALPRRASSPATLAALRNASLAWPAACLRWSLASPRLLLRLSVWVGFIVGTPVVGGQFPRSWPIPGWRGVRGASPHRQGALAVATQDPQYQRLRIVVDAGAEAEIGRA